MSATAFATLVAIGDANLALWKHWMHLSTSALTHVHELTQASCVAFVEGPLVMNQLITVRATAAAADIAGEVEVAGHWPQGTELLGLLARGLPCLVADYAGDMNLKATAC